MSLFARVALLCLLSLGFVRLTAVEADEIAALRTKAERGNALAQYNLGLAYAQGRLIAGDPAEAFAWLTLASESGATGKALDSLLGNISDQQLSEGRRRLGLYRAALVHRTAPTTPGHGGQSRLAPRGFSLDPVAPPPRATPPEQPPAAVPVGKTPEAVTAPVTTTPAEGLTDLSELAQARKDLEKIRAELTTANGEIAALRATIARLQVEAAPAKTAEPHAATDLPPTPSQPAPASPAVPPAAPDKPKADEPPPHP